MSIRKPFILVLVLVLALVLLVTPPPADAQRPAKIPRIGALWTSSLAPTAYLLEAFRSGLRELGYVEGQNVAIEFRSAEARSERLPGLAADLVRLGVDVIVAAGTDAAQAARNATTTIPVVMINVGDPVGTGLIQSIARPGGNVTGLSRLDHELSGKRLQLISELVPRISRVAILHNPDRPNSVLALKELELKARASGIELQPLPVRGPNEFPAALQAARGRAGALIVLGDPDTFRHRARIAELATEHRLPALFTASEYVDVGGLVAYSPNLSDMYRRAALYVDKLLKGARAADLPVEQPTKFELVINLKTARTLGLTIAPAILIQADRVVE